MEGHMAEVLLRNARSNIRDRYVAEVGKQKMRKGLAAGVGIAVAVFVLAGVTGIVESVPNRWLLAMVVMTPIAIAVSVMGKRAARAQFDVEEMTVEDYEDIVLEVVASIEDDAHLNSFDEMNAAHMRSLYVPRKDDVILWAGRASMHKNTPRGDVSPMGDGVFIVTDKGVRFISVGTESNWLKRWRDIAQWQASMVGVRIQPVEGVPRTIVFHEAGHDPLQDPRVPHAVIGRTFDA